MAAAGIAASALVLPGVVGVGVGVLVAALAASRGSTAFALFVAASAGVVTTVAVDRMLRRLLPLAVLLRLSLDFPDRAPSRIRMALRSGTLRHLDEQLARVARHGVDGSPSEAASRILELMAALARYDRRTRGHSERVRAFTDVIADELHLSRLDRDRLRWASLLHDIGKLHVDLGVLNKAGRLDGDEWRAVKAHPHVGAKIAEPLLPWLGDWGAAIEFHHERWDGNGYPHGIQGDDIPLAARIVAVADAFEVMTAARSYKQPMSVPSARRELLACAGKQFDPQIVRALLQASLTRMRWIAGPSALVLGLLPRWPRAEGASRRVLDVPAVRAAAAAAIATLSLPAVEGGGPSVGETAEAGESRAPAGVVRRPDPVAATDTAITFSDHLAAVIDLGVPSIGGTAFVAPEAPAAASGTAPAAEVQDSGAQDLPALPLPRGPGEVPAGGTAEASSPHSGRAPMSPPGTAVSEVARSGSGPGHGSRVSDVARATPKPSAR